MIDKTIECTIMFADIAGSTKLYESLGDLQAQFIISQCLSRMSKICNKYSGVIVKTVGDEIMCYFPMPDDAVIAAQAINQFLENDSSHGSTKLAVRTGLHCGPVVEQDGDFFGDAVNLAARMTSIAKAKQIMTTQATVEKLSAPLAETARLYDEAAVKGKQEEIKMFEILWGQQDVTTIISSRDLAKQLVTTRLKLCYRGKEVSVGMDRKMYVIGRGRQCGLVVDALLASRSHALIEYRRNKFVLVDQSTNGTFVKNQDGREVYLRREELPLMGKGIISLGQATAIDTENLIYFECD